MVAAAHRHDSFVRAAPDRVWAALTDPDLTATYCFGARVVSTFEPGAAIRYERGGVVVADGALETVDPGHRLSMTARLLTGLGSASEPPGRLTCTLTPADERGQVTRISVHHDQLALSPLTWERARAGWRVVLDGLKSVLETGSALAGVDDGGVVDDPTAIEANWHRAQAVTANNSVWELLDGRRHTPAEADELLQRAYAAAYHWRRAAGATAVNQARAAWLVGRSHAVLGQGELALHHATRCAELTEAAADDAADFDHAYVHELRARSLACLGRLDEAREAYRRASAVVISDADDRSILAGDLAAEPWFGLDRG